MIYNIIIYMDNNGRNLIEYNTKISKITLLVGCAASLFIPLLGIISLAIGINRSYKQETLELKHLFYLNLIGLLASLLVFIYTIGTTYF